MYKFVQFQIESCVSHSKTNNSTSLLANEFKNRCIFMGGDLGWWPFKKKKC